MNPLVNHPVAGLYALLSGLDYLPAFLEAQMLRSGGLGDVQLLYHQFYAAFPVVDQAFHHF